MNDDRQLRSRKQVAFLFAGAFLLIIAALFVPDSWVRGIKGLYQVDQRADAFSDMTARVDEALQRGEPIPVTREKFDRMFPAVQMRRVLRAGPMTSDDVVDATEMLRQFQTRVRAEESDSSRAAVRALRNQKLVEAFPRLDAAKLQRELKVLHRQIESARFEPEPAPDAGGSNRGDCATCHANSRALPEGRDIDPAAVWPRLAARLGDGDELPVLMDATEHRFWAKELDSEKTCTSCHAAHGTADFGVDDDMRRENMGLWVNTATMEGLLMVQAKVQNKTALHRVPGGAPKHAYALVVRAVAGDETPLKPWQGKRLPDHLQTSERRLGFALQRVMVGRDGERVTEPKQAVDVIEDTRLEPRRFTDDRFLFRLKGDTGWRAVVELWYLPDQRTWEGARVIEKQTRSGN